MNKIIDGVEIPRLMLGTSPFIGAGQFGVRAFDYQCRFYLNPDNITKLIVEAVNFGITWIQAIVGYPVIVKAIKEARKITGKEIQIAGTIGAKDWAFELEVMKELGGKIFLTHGRLTDRLDYQFKDCIERISAAGIAGAVTHNPGVVIPKLADYDKVKIIMVPVNKLGRFMLPSPEATLEAIRKTDKIVIGKKILAAGDLKPSKENLEYVANFTYGVAIGIASSKELEETFGLAKEIWGN